MKALTLFLLLILGGVTILAQDTFHNPDKVYLHLDRHLYAQGDTIWMKGYAMHRGSNKPSNKSYSLHIQMLDEQGKEVHNYKMLTVDGIAKGQIQVSSVMAPGFYQIIAHTGYMKNFDQRFFHKTTIEVRKPVRHKTMSVLFDKVAYEVGDTAEVTFRMFDKNKSPIAGDRFACEYSQGDAKPKRKRLRCNDDGTVRFPFPITAGSYEQMPKIQLSYFNTEDDEHPLTQVVYVPMYNDDILLEFYPEGGDLVKGIASKVAFKASDIRGAYLDVSIDLFEDGERIRSISTIHEGMGMFTLLPKQADYTVKITSHKGIDTIYNLPKVKESGYTLSLLNQTERNVNLLVNQNRGIDTKCKLWISYCDSLWDVINYTAQQTNRIRIDKTQLPQGIVTFTISDEHSEPLAERLVYVEKNRPQLSIDASQQVLATRQKVDFTLSLDVPTKAHLSFAVVDSFLASNPNLSPSNIKAYAELESELHGRITNLNQYIGGDASVAHKRDLLLLTHGWRRFDWVINESVLSSMKVHDFNRVVGQVTRLGQPYSNAQIQVLMLNKSFATSECVADEEGRFFIDPIYETHADQNLLISSKSRKGSRRVTLKLDKTDTLLFSSVIKNNRHNLLPLLHRNDYTTVNKETTTVEEPFMMYESVLLKEFEVSVGNQEWGMDDYFKVAEDVALGKDLEDASSFYWLLNQMTNLIDDTTDPDARMGRIRIKTYSTFDRSDMIHLPNGQTVSFFHDDLRRIFDEVNTPAAMIYINGEPWGYESGSLDHLKTTDIVSIAVLDGVQGYNQFGLEAYYGAIMVETYDENIVNEANMSNNHTVFGKFINAREFSKQLYDTPEQSKVVGDDNRVTLHWEPLLETDEMGKAKVSFYTGDIPGKKQVIVQGFDDQGNLYYQTQSFIVKGPLER